MSKPTRILSPQGWVYLLEEIAPKLNLMEVRSGPHAGEAVEVIHAQSTITLCVGNFKALVTLEFPKHDTEFTTLYPAYQFIDCELNGSLQYAEKNMGRIERLIEMLRFVREQTEDVQVNLKPFEKYGTP